ncbi:hypothetical protein ACFLUP_02450 [Chloroflexota bacterium]
MAAATHVQGFTSLTEMIPALVFHVASLFTGMVIFRLGQRVKEPAQ